MHGYGVYVEPNGSMFCGQRHNRSQLHCTYSRRTQQRAAPSLLSSYDAERRPVANENARLSVHNYHREGPHNYH